ncbi:MAG: bifunctional acetate--CoA ligase family protein/GNAT family N-acetyltransferase [Gammaproteobacteria bacterium]|nr:bifunctional acetate--CoA ligase family protein/GNAT family N-acetyltransferase [Gammaproteobacteria bacterium]MBT8050401.1 bifunctional acetate--CoA ligase family protein/GNAT family N-acetyltransferase [Gammaproteobacteria bacterium]MBT8055925.1 bifunctional acetate--CoA ligase family protein/GNAT family N-acetyltransferase [Gammaproteobacteria bacterium]
MQPDRLQQLFKPGSVALFGASEEEGALGTVVLENLKSAGFHGEITLINPKYEEIGGEPCFPALADSGREVDLAIIVTPAKVVPNIITDCGESGVGAAIVISANFSEAGPKGAALEAEMLRRARRYGLRILGPNCLGVIRTDIGLNATFSAGNAIPGRIAVISQSGALCTAILDWAENNDVGFSSLISTGIGADVDFGEILDFVAMDPATDSIMLYIEGLKDSRRFMSALRAAARTKPVVIMKSGRHEQGSKAAVSHTGALVGSDAVFDSALRRAGALRVDDFTDFFATAATLSSGVRTSGNRLAVVTNAGGPGVMAADHCTDVGLTLADIGQDTIEKLNGVLPESWSHNNPVDVLGDAGPDRYEEAVKACLSSANVDAVLVILTPQAQTAPSDVAEKLCALRKNTRKPVLACWMGDASVGEAREMFKQCDIPAYSTPEAAVRAFAALASYHDSQQQLLQVPGPVVQGFEPELENAEIIIENAMEDGRRVLNQAESKAILAAFHIPIAQSIPARSAQEAILVAQELGYPVAMKIDSPDITHKTDVGGVRLGLPSARHVRNTYQEMMTSIGKMMPEARLNGVVIEPMWTGRHGRELMIGVVRDEVFGPAVSFGLGGTLVEVLRDREVALPPLNDFLARRLISRTKAAKLLESTRGAPEVDREALVEMLLRVSQLATELPTIVEMDMNPVIASPDGVVAIDARIVVEPYNEAARPFDHMAIHPYPRELVQRGDLSDGTQLVIRPIRPEDALLEREFVNNLSERSKYLRFMYSLQEITPEALSRFTQIDYDREMALVAVVKEEGKDRQVGVARYYTLADPNLCEFAIVVADDWQHRGIARRLMAALVEAARDGRHTRMVGTVLAENRRMLKFVQSLGFETESSADDPQLMEVMLDL